MLNINEGDKCPHCFLGNLQIAQEPCYCSACRNPPCSACIDAWLECPLCHWRSDDNDDNCNKEVVMAYVVKVVFAGSSKLYCYYYDLAVKPTIGDIVLVDSPYSGETRVTIKEIEPAINSSKTRLKHILKIVQAFEDEDEDVDYEVYGTTLTTSNQEENIMNTIQDLSDLSGKEIMDVATKQIQESLKTELFKFLSNCIQAKVQREKWVRNRQSQIVRIDQLMQDAVKVFDAGLFDTNYATELFKELTQIIEERVS